MNPAYWILVVCVPSFLNSFLMVALTDSVAFGFALGFAIVFSIAGLARCLEWHLKCRKAARLHTDPERAEALVDECTRRDKVATKWLNCHYFGFLFGSATRKRGRQQEPDELAMIMVAMQVKNMEYELQTSNRPVMAISMVVRGANK